MKKKNRKGRKAESRARIENSKLEAQGATTKGSIASRDFKGAFHSPQKSSQSIPRRRRHFVRTEIDGIIFHHDSRYKLKKVLGSGAYGNVASALDTKTGNKVAVKRVDRLLDDPIDAKRILREIKILRHLAKHGNIVKLLDVFLEPVENFNCLYIVFELMQTDLRKIVQSKNKLEKLHHQYMTYQLLCGLKFMHSANIWHRDLKPANLLVNANSKLKICDFGLARGTDPEEVGSEVTDYVVTRWYRAPEVMVCDSYTEKIDVWSVGCILAEMYKRKPVFRGADSRDQVSKYLSLLGTPEPEDLSFITNKHAKRFVESHATDEKFSKQKLIGLCPGIPDDALDLLFQMLQFNPEKRISVDDAMSHPFYANIRKKKNEIVCDKPFNFAFEKELKNVPDLRKEFRAEAKYYAELNLS